MQLLGHLPSLARELEPFFWTMYSVLALKPDWWTVPTMELVHITVPTLKMLVSVAALHVRMYRTHSKLRPPFLLVRFSYKYGGAYN